MRKRLLRKANQAFRRQDYGVSLRLYEWCARDNPPIRPLIKLNISLCKKRISKRAVDLVDEHDSQHMQLFTYFLRCMDAECQNKILINGVDVWPLIKLYFYRYRHRAIFIKASLSGVLEESRKITNPLIAGEVKECRCNKDPFQPYKRPVFLCRDGDHKEVGEGDVLINRYSDPFISKIESRGGLWEKVVVIARDGQQSGDYYYKPRHKYLTRSPLKDVAEEEIVINYLPVKRLMHQFGCYMAVEEEDVLSHLQGVMRKLKFYCDLINELNPDVIAVRCYYSTEWHALLFAAFLRGVPIIDIQHGRTGPFHPAYTHWGALSLGSARLLPSLYLLWSGRWARCLSETNHGELGLSEKIVVTGLPRVDFFKGICAQNKVSLLDEFCGKFDICVLMSLQQYQRCRFPDYVKECVLNSLGKGVGWILRRHPQGYLQDGIYPYLKEVGQSNVCIDLPDELPLDVVLANVHLNLTFDSTVAYEAADLGIKTMFLGGVEQDFIDLISEGMAERVFCSSDILDACEREKKCRRNSVDDNRSQDD